MPRRLLIIFGLFFGMQLGGAPAYANCALIDRLDKMQIIETRLARNPDLALFPSDMRQLRILAGGITRNDTLDAFGSSANAEPGATMLRFLDDSRNLLQRASLYDSTSVRPHFSANVRATLENAGVYLKQFRCTAQQIAVDVPITENLRAGRNTDAEDLADIAETLRRIAQEVVSLRGLIVAMGLVGFLSVAVPAFRRWQILRRRRAKRHNAAYMTSYAWAGYQGSGTLVDINCHGAKMQHDPSEPPPKGASLSILIGDGSVKGTVVWSNVHYSGVQFQRTLSLKLVDVVCQQTQNGAPKGAA